MAEKMNTDDSVNNKEEAVDKIPINEWPVSNSMNTQNWRLPRDSILGKRKHSVVNTLHQRQFRQDYSSCIMKQSCNTDSLRSGREPVKEPLAPIRVAKWWRREQIQMKEILSTMKSLKSANTSLFYLSRTPECQHFLQNEKIRLEKMQEPRADVYAALASIEDWLEQYELAHANITKAIALEPECCEYRWLKEKLQRQCDAAEVQKSHLKLQSNELVFPAVEEVERVPAKDLTVQKFREKYIIQRKPVIVTGAVCHMTTSPWTFAHIKAVAGSTKINVKRSVQQSVEWARLEDSKETTVEEFIDCVLKGATDDYLFDWSLPIHCPKLAAELSLPEYFTGNYLQKTAPGSLYKDSWPSLFIAPAGIVSDLHVDAFASSFWMALFQGEKRWTFFEQAETPLLYPLYFHSLDPVFRVDMKNLDLASFPLVASTRPKQCILESGELLYVPSGSPHFVENLSPSVAVSSNYVDASNIKQVCEELRVSGLLDPRADDLLKELEHPEFMNAPRNVDQK